MKNKLKIFLVLTILNIIFFSQLFFPVSKNIVTPSFFGGDINTIFYPYKKIACDNIRAGKIPTWNNNINNGYPVYAEGEIGFFNPFNIVSCLMTPDYRQAFNYQILFTNIFAQFGFILLAQTLGLSIYSGFLGAIAFTFSPIIVMNYLQISIIYPILLLPYILNYSIKILKKNSLKQGLLLTLFLALQFLTCHYQMFFLSCVFIFIFVLSYMFFCRKELLKKEILLKIFLFALFTIFAVGLVLFQLLPGLEFAQNSSRSMQELLGNYSAIYDQDLKLKSMLTFLSPYILGWPKIGTYKFTTTHPWESDIYIYIIPALSLLYLIFNFRYFWKNKIVQTMLFSGFTILLLAFGKNSPIYFIHSLPYFSSLRFPSRFILIFVFATVVLSMYGFDLFIKKRRLGKKIIIGLTVLVFFESMYFFYDFHVLKNTTQLYKDSKISSYLTKNDLKVNIFTPTSSLEYFNDDYVEHGYLKNSDRFPNLADDLLSGNINSIYDVSSFGNAPIPQLKRYARANHLIMDEIDKNKMTLVYPKVSINMLALSNVTHFVSMYKIDNAFFKHLQTFRLLNTNYYLYELPKISQTFFDKYIYVDNLQGLEYEVANYGGDYLIMEENVKLKNGEKLYLYKQNYYPTWRALVNGKPVKIYKANFSFMAVIVPDENATIEFKHVDDIFGWGWKISAFFWLVFALLYSSCKGTVSYFFKR